MPQGGDNRKEELAKAIAVQRKKIEPTGRGI